MAGEDPGQKAWAVLCAHPVIFGQVAQRSLSSVQELLPRVLGISDDVWGSTELWSLQVALSFFL